MERSKKMRKILTGFFLAAFLICIGLFGYSVTYAAEDAGFTLNGEFAESYELGDYLEFPAGTFTVGGTQYPAVVILYYPDGSAAGSPACSGPLPAADSPDQKRSYGVPYGVTRAGYFLGGRGTPFFPKTRYLQGEIKRNGLSKPISFCGELYAHPSGYTFS